MTGRSTESAVKQAVYERNYRRCRDRALTKLRRNHEAEYRQLLEEEKARDEQEGKTWIGIDLASGTPVRRSSATRNPAITNARTEQETGGNL